MVTSNLSDTKTQAIFDKLDDTIQKNDGRFAKIDEKMWSQQNDYPKI